MGGDFAKELKEKMEGKKIDEPFSFLASIGREEKKKEREVQKGEEIDRDHTDKHVMKSVGEEDPMGFDVSYNNIVIHVLETTVFG